MGKYFSIAELCETDTGLNNTPNRQQTKNLEDLIKVLDVIREEWTELCKINNWGSAAIIVNSGFRSDEVNKAIKGSKNSEHCLGFAADIEPRNQRNLEFWNFIVDYVKTKNIGFSQLINEKPRAGIPSWIHLSINGKNGQRKQIFTLV